MADDKTKLSADAQKLIKAGWKCLRRTRLRADWESPYDGGIYSQSYAVEYEVQLACKKRLTLEQNSWLTRG